MTSKRNTLPRPRPQTKENPVTQLAEPPAQTRQPSQVVENQQPELSQPVEHQQAKAVPETAVPEEFLLELSDALERAERAEEELKRIVVAPRCDGRNILNGAVCNRQLTIAAGPGTVIDCPRCRKRHEF